MAVDYAAQDYKTHAEALSIHVKTLQSLHNASTNTQIEHKINKALIAINTWLEISGHAAEVERARLIDIQVKAGKANDGTR